MKCFLDHGSGLHEALVPALFPVAGGVVKGKPQLICLIILRGGQIPLLISSTTRFRPQLLELPIPESHQDGVPVIVHHKLSVPGTVVEPGLLILI